MNGIYFNVVNSVYNEIVVLTYIVKMSIKFYVHFSLFISVICLKA